VDDAGAGESDAEGVDPDGGAGASEPDAKGVDAGGAGVRQM
jgi:hypothetical protein